MLAPILFSCLFVGLSRAVTCPPTDDAGSALKTTGTDGSFTTCTYPAAGICEYFSNGSFSSGSSTCPNSATSSTSSGGGSTSTNSSSTVNCPPTDGANSPLTSSGVDGTFVFCTYQTAGHCEYFTIGEFSSGSSDCPKSIPAQGSSSSASSSSASSTATSTVTPTNTTAGATSASTPTGSSQPSGTPATPATPSSTSTTPASSSSGASGASSSNTSSALPSVSFRGGVLALAAAVLGFSLL